MEDEAMKVNEPLSEQETQAIIRARIKEVLAFRDRCGRGCPAIMVIDATHGVQFAPEETELIGDNFVLKEALPAMCFETFEQFEQEAIHQGDVGAIEQVRSAVGKRPGKLVVYTMIEGRGIVSIVHPLTGMIAQ